MINNMKIYNYILSAIFAIAMIASCTPATPTVEDLVLEASKDAIEGDGIDQVAFTVYYGGEDVTAMARVYIATDNSELVNKSFSSTMPGEYEFYATYEPSADLAAISENISVTVRGGATLSADKLSITADGSDMVTFTVTQDGNDVTSESVLYIIPAEGEPIAQEGFTFSATEFGVYNFYALKGSVPTNQLQISAIHEDPQPENTNFKERAMVTEFTGTWCGYCSLVKAAMYQLEDSGWDDGVVIEAHDGDIMATAYVSSLINKYGANMMGYPHVTYNMDNQHSSSNYGSIATNQSYITQNTTEVITAYTCTVGISATFEQGSNENELSVFAGFKFTEPGEYRIAAWLLENGITATQANNYPNLVTTEEVSTHRNVLRDVSNSTEFTGDDVNMTEAGSYAKEWTFNVSKLYNKNPENALVAVFVARKESNGKYIVNNIIKCHFGDTVLFEYAE